MKEKLLLWLFGLMISVQVFAQNRTLSGTVKDATTGEALIGVNVTGKGTTIGTTTDMDGKYTVEMPKDVTTLIFSYVGYTNIEKAITSKTIDVSLSSEGEKLEDLVVTAAAIKREKRELSFATQTVSSEDANKLVSSPLTALQGKAAGVRVSSNGGQLGSSTRVVLRGEVSLTGNNNALIVVDGVPINNRSEVDDNSDQSKSLDFGNRANDINPDDIETYTILKGPAATALYGSRGASGVIVITTKKGTRSTKAGNPIRVSVGTSFTFDKAYILLQRQDQYGQGAGATGFFGENFSWGPKFDGSIRPWSGIVADANGDPTRLYKPYVAIKDQIQNFYNTGVTNVNNFSIEGGFDKSSFRVSYSNTNNTGIVPNTYYKKHNLSIGGVAQLIDKLSIDYTVTYANTKIKTASTGSEFANPIQAVLQTPVDIPLSDMRDYNNPYYGFEGFYGAYAPNPYFILGTHKNTNKADNIFGQVTLNYKIIEDLDLTARIGNNFTNNFTEIKEPKYTYTADPDQPDGGSLGSYLGRYYYSTTNANNMNIDLISSYKKLLGKKKDYSVGLIGGFNFTQDKLDVTSARTIAGLYLDNIYSLSNSVYNPYVSNDVPNQKKSVLGLYANASFGIKNALFLEYSARNDWSSTLPKGNNGYFYQSGGISFLPTALFKKENKYISYIKLRGNVGQVGKDAPLYRTSTYASINPQYDDNFIPDYQYSGPFAIGDINSPGGLNLFNTVTINNNQGNSAIKPEVTTSYEAGLDLGFFKNQINIQTTFYKQISKNQIVNAAVASSSGFSTKLTNIGKVSNKGVELDVKATPISNLKGITWDVYYNFSKNISLIEKVSDENDEVVISSGSFATGVIVAKEGKPFGTFKTNEYLIDTLTNKIVVSTTSGNPLLATKQGYQGSYQPKYTMGWGTTLSWKGLSASVAFDMKKGGVFYSLTKEQGEFNGTTLTTLLNDRQPRIIPNTVYLNPLTGVYEENDFIFSTPDFNYFGGLPESESLVDASFIKLREVSLGYKIPAKAFKNSKITGINIALVGKNLKTWLPKENTFADPEVSTFGSSGNTQGFEAPTAPTARSYGFSLNVQF